MFKNFLLLNHLKIQNLHIVSICYINANVYILQIYILQHLEFAIQIFERGTIYDLKAGNKYREELMPIDFHGDYSLIDAWFRPKKEILFEKLDAMCYAYRNFEPKIITTKASQFYQYQEYTN